MKVGDLVRDQGNHKVQGIIVRCPDYAPKWERDLNDCWMFITSTPDGKFVGQVHSWIPEHLEVISESR